MRVLDAPVILPAGGKCVNIQRDILHYMNGPIAIPGRFSAGFSRRWFILLIRERCTILITVAILARACMSEFIRREWHDTGEDDTTNP